MPFVTPEDVGTTPRGSLSAKRRLQAWERTKGTCVICEEPIDGVRERWIVEHIRALELGGADELTNMGPAHEACGREKTRDDHARTARAKRQKVRHIGASVSVRPLPGARSTALKRKVNGTVVPRGSHPQRKAGPRAASRSARAAGATCSRNPVGSRQLPSEFENRSRTDAAGSTLMTKPAAARPDRSRQAFNGAGEILPAIPRHLDFLFDERPLLPDEDPGPYDTLLSTFVQQVRPADVIEAIWVKDIVDLIWETKRLRRWRRQILGQARLEAATKLALPVIEAQNRNTFRADFEHRREAEALALGWLEHDNAEAARMEQLLRARGLTAADVDAQAFQVKLPDLERIERMIASADHRRDALLREIERKRASLSQHVRAAAADVIDAESPPRESACAAQPRT
ncbi:HNH endonuclease [Methylobacterium nigriterrae]|uniref:HNH endonuclease n=1 Tax=Methylobacterium nigriterrae TaxID=3127512 RepID=UPI003013310F